MHIYTRYIGGLGFVWFACGEGGVAGVDAAREGGLRDVIADRDGAREGDADAAGADAVADVRLDGFVDGSDGAVRDGAADGPSGASPGAPTWLAVSVKCLSVSTYQAVVQWPDGSDETQYRLLHNGTLLVESAADATYHIAEYPFPGAHEFTIEACNLHGCSAPRAGPVPVPLACDGPTVLFPPPTATLLVECVSPGSHRLTVSFDAVVGALNYRVWDEVTLRGVLPATGDLSWTMPDRAAEADYAFYVSTVSATQETARRLAVIDPASELSCPSP
jgi:hypothetical protein